MSLEGINVCIRVRPFIQREIDAKETDGNDWIVDGENNSIQSTIPGKKQMNFDKVFDNYATNSMVYDDVANRIIDSAFEGVNGTILAYGQTSSGKTFTMSSIMKSSFTSIFTRIRNDKTRNYEVSAAYCEVYNENITDLADPNKTNLSVTQETGAVRDLTIKSCGCEQDALRFHEEGTKNRRVGATKMNSESSRSHSIFQIFVKSTPVDNDKQAKSSLPQGVRSNKAVNNAAGTLEATINFVDLAGSERASQTEAKGERLQEGAQINRSLLVLGKVIRTLASRKNEKPPYRESKLTQLLRTSLGGNCRTTMICCATMAKSNVLETTSTLSFAFNAKNVVNTVGVNETLDDKQMLIRAQERYAVLRLKFIQFYDVLKSQNVPMSAEIESFIAQLSVQKGALTRLPIPSSTQTPTAPLQSPSTAQLEAQLGALGSELAGLGEINPILKKQRLLLDPSNPANCLVTLGNSAPTHVYTIPVETAMQTEVSVMAQMIGGGQKGDNVNNVKDLQKAQKRKSMDPQSNEDKSMSDDNGVIWYSEPLEIQPNTAKVMELLGYTSADEAMSEFFDQNFAALEEDLTNMLVSNGLFVDTRSLQTDLDNKTQQVVTLKNDYDQMYEKFTKMVTELQETIEVQKTKSDSEIVALKASIAEYEAQLKSMESHSTTHQFELQSVVAQSQIEKQSKEQEIKQLQEQLDQMSQQHLSAITEFTDAVQSKEHARMSEINGIIMELERVQAEYQQYKDDNDILLEETEHDFKKQLEQLETDRDDEVAELRRINDKLRTDHKSEYAAQMAKFEAVRNNLLDELQEVEEHNFKEYSQLETKFTEMENQYTTQVVTLQKSIDVLNSKVVEGETKIHFLQSENQSKLDLIAQLRSQKDKELQFITDRVKSVAGDKDKVITTMESELNTLRQYQQQQQTTYESLQSQYRLLEAESSSLKRETAEFKVQITTKDYELQRIKQRAEEVAKKQREDSETLVKRFKEKISKIQTDRDVELEKKDNEIVRLKELQQVFASKVKKSISEAKGERDEALAQVDQKDKERRRLEHDTDTIKLRYSELQKTTITLKQDLAKQREAVHSLETAVSEEASLKKFHVQENLILKKQLQQIETRYNDHITTVQQKFERDIVDRNRVIQGLEAHNQQVQNEIQYYKQTNQETVNKLGQAMAEVQSLKMQLQQQTAMSSLVSNHHHAPISHYAAPSLSSMPLSTSTRGTKKQPIYEDNDEDETPPQDLLPRPFSHSSYSSSSSSNISTGLTSSPYKRLDLTKPTATVGRSKPEVVKFVGGRTTRAAAARTRQMNDENH